MTEPHRPTPPPGPEWPDDHDPDEAAAPEPSAHDDGQEADTPKDAQSPEHSPQGQPQPPEDESPRDDEDEPRPEPGRAGASGAPGGSEVLPAVLPTFSPGRLRRQLAADTAAYAGIIALAVAVIFLPSLLGEAEEARPLALADVLFLVVVLLWVGMSVVGARAYQRLRLITPLIEQQPPAAEAELAGIMKRWPLNRSVRLLVYHRLAMLRHRQQRYGETAAICHTLLQHRHRSLRPVRGQLLLMLIEACLASGDLAGAHAALNELYRVPLSLGERLTRLALQTRYLLAAGYHDLALDGIAHKVQLVELMPGPQCGAMHAMFALAAERARRPSLAQWLSERATLLLTPEQMEHVRDLDRAPLAYAAPWET